MSTTRALIHLRYGITNSRSPYFFHFTCGYEHFLSVDDLYCVLRCLEIPGEEELDRFYQGWWRRV